MIVVDEWRSIILIEMETTLQLFAVTDYLIATCAPPE